MHVTKVVNVKGEKATLKETIRAEMASTRVENNPSFHLVSTFG